MIYKTKKNKLNNKKRNSKKGGSFPLPKNSTDQLQQENAELVRCQQELTKCKEELQECRENLFLSRYQYDSRGQELELTRVEYYKCLQELELTREDYDKCQQELTTCKEELEIYRHQQSFIMPQTGWSDRLSKSIL